MRRAPALTLALAAALAGAGCSTSPCQSLGEKLCACTGLASSSCTTQVENQLKTVNPGQSQLDACQALLDRCKQPAGAVFCEWLSTDTGQVACGLAPEPPPTVVTTTATASR
jgi:hypothetical protein